MLSKDELVVGEVYLISSRNFSLGVYDGNGGFIGIREKFGSRYLFTEYFDDGMNHLGTVQPLKRIATVPEGVELREMDQTQDVMTGRAVAFDRPVASGGRGWYFIDTGESSDKISSQSRVNKPLFDFLEKLKQ